jgi:hypothetical protein
LSNSSPKTIDNCPENRGNMLKNKCSSGERSYKKARGKNYFRKTCQGRGKFRFIRVSIFIHSFEIYFWNIYFQIQRKSRPLSSNCCYTTCYSNYVIAVCFRKSCPFLGFNVSSPTSEEPSLLLQKIFHPLCPLGMQFSLVPIHHEKNRRLQTFSGIPQKRP